MPAHCFNNETTPILNGYLKDNGGNKIECTTDDYFGLLGNYIPPSGFVKESFDNAAQVYGTKATWYGIAGSASNCISACRALGGENQIVLVQRNSHRAIVHGFRITGSKLSFINP